MSRHTHGLMRRPPLSGCGDVVQSPVSADGGCEGLSESDFPIIPWASAQGKKSVENGGQSTDSPSSAPMFPMNQSSNALTEVCVRVPHARPNGVP